MGGLSENEKVLDKLVTFVFLPCLILSKVMPQTGSLQWLSCGHSLLFTFFLLSTSPFRNPSKLALQMPGVVRKMRNAAQTRMVRFSSDV